MLVKAPLAAVVVVVMGMMIGLASAVSKPAGCSYSSGVFTCDYR